MLEVFDLTKNFGGVVALNKVNLKVLPQTIFSIIGPNGAGKTTLFNLITGFLEISNGGIKLFDKDLNGLSPFRICKLGICRTFQSCRLFNSMTVFENVWVGQNYLKKFAAIDLLSFTSSSEKHLKAEVEEILDLVGIIDKKNIPIRSLSYGNRRLVEIARALSTRPKILLLDEPTAGMNFLEAEKLMLIIERIKNEKKVSVLLIEHHMEVVMGLSDYIAVLNFGEKIAEGTPFEIRNNEKVIEAYLGEE